MMPCACSASMVCATKPSTSPDVFASDGRSSCRAKRYSDYSAFGAGAPVTAGHARGLDVFAQRKGSERYTGFVGYSYLDASLRLTDGHVSRSPFDVTHSMTASATATLNANWSVGSTARYGTGTPHTPIVGGSMAPGGRVAPLCGALMSERLPSYVRTDARLMRYVRTPKVLVTTFVEVVNVFNRRNMSALTYDAGFTTARPVHSFFANRTVVAGGELQFR